MILFPPLFAISQMIMDSASVLTQIVQQLRFAGLVTSSRGPAGGYRLAKPASQISLLDIIDSVSIRRTVCTKKCDSVANQIVDQVWLELEKLSEDKLRGIMLNELSNKLRFWKKPPFIFNGLQRAASATCLQELTLCPNESRTGSESIFVRSANHGP